MNLKYFEAKMITFKKSLILFTFSTAVVVVVLFY